MTGLKIHSPNDEISAPKLTVSQPSVISAIRAILVKFFCMDTAKVCRRHKVQR